MGNCCDGGDRLEITSAKNGTAQATSYGPRHSEHAAAGATARDGHQRDAQNVRMTTTTTTTAPPQTATPAGVPPDFQLQAPLRYPGDARGVYYQPEGPSAVLSHALEDKDSKVPQDVSKAATAAAAALRETSTQAATVVTSTVTSTAVAVVSQPEPAVDIVTSAIPQRQQSANYQPRDVMISYSRTDGDVMVQIREQLEAHGFSVWVDENSIAAGADFLSKIGEAIIDAKFFICILSEKAVRSKYCRDEVALAYVSNTAIFPVNLQPREHLLPLMDTGLKLQLSNYNWTSLTDPATRADNVKALISTMKSEMDDLDDQAQTEGGGPGSSPSLSPPSSPGGAPLTSSEGRGVGDREVTSPSDIAVTLSGKDVKVADKGGSPVQSPTPTTVVGPPDYKPMRKLRERNRAVMMLHGDDDVSKVMPEQFWNDQFGVVDYVTWDRFTSAFLQVFKRQVEATFTSEDQQQLLDILKRELEVDDDERIYKYQLIAFCSVYGDMLAVWPRVQEQARESFAMREVFNMDSSVRVEAIENLGKFRSAAVIDALRDLLTDPDANVRAVATVSLSRTNADDPVTIRHILRTLNDKDRLVREAGCLALGHLRARQAISKLSHLWRNDVISHVRDAAAVALRQIGGQEVEDVMRVTKVLAEEIRSLTEVQA